MPAAAWGWSITPEELRSWIVVETPGILAINKPPFVVCHPSKHGPWSSLIGACREFLGAETLHMPCRLDRETSGIVVLARDRATASRLQTAVQQRRVRKTYLAILCGSVDAERVISGPLGRDITSSFAARQCVNGVDAKPAETLFVPLAQAGGFTLVRVHPRTGRMHQIRVHAAHMGHAIAGDKLYGPDPDLMLEFVSHGFTPRLAAALPLNRHALHAAELCFDTSLGCETYAAPLARDLLEFFERGLAKSV